VLHSWPVKGHRSLSWKDCCDHALDSRQALAALALLLLLVAIPCYNAVSNFNADLDALLVTHPAYGAYSAAAFDGTTLTDVSGNGRDATVTAGSVSVRTVSANGASNGATVLAGDTSAKVLWPVGIIPATFTVCSVTRCDDAGSSCKRILTGGGSPSGSKDWMHGQHDTRRGIAHYGWTNDGWQTTWGESKGTVTDWLVMCGTNGNPQTPNLQSEP